MRFLLAIAIFLVLITVCTADIITVAPDGTGDYPTIQGAIDVAYNGDTIVLERGVYRGFGNRDLDFHLKAITISSISPKDPNCVNDTVIDCEGTAEVPHRAFYVHRGENILTVISGITITGGYHSGGGAIQCESSDISLVGCVFRNNTAHFGGAIHLYSSRSIIINCIFRGNDAIQTGGALFIEIAESSPVTIENCLIVSNSAGRDAGGIASYHSAYIYITNTTIADNIVWGGYPSPEDIGSGGGLYCGYNSRVTIIDSIVAFNYAEAGRQLTAGNGFEEDPVPAFNVSIWYSNIQGGWGEPNLLIEDGLEYVPGDGLFYGDPLFTRGPFGEYYLSQFAAGQLEQSPCVDSGSGDAIVFKMNKLTTRSDVWFDVYDDNKKDMGYHYPMATPVVECKYCDLFFDGLIDISDISILALNWLSDCAEPQDCDHADINLDYYVNISDLSMIAKCFYMTDTVPPDPNTAEWDIEPRMSDTYIDAIEMSSRISYDDWFGADVEYYFQCLGFLSHDSGWQQDYDISNTKTYVENPEYYLDTGLDLNRSYAYVLRVRDPRGNTTRDSKIIYAKTGHEMVPPDPDPSQWEKVPYNTGDSIRMVATVSTDENGPIEYYFRYTDEWGVSNGTGDGHDSGWQSSKVYDDRGMTDGEYYHYRVRAKDGHDNETEESPVMGALLDSSILDDTPPIPNPSLWESDPNNTGTSIIMKAKEASDAHGPVEYYFRATNEAGGEPNDIDDGHDSGWQESSFYEDIGLTDGKYYYYRVRARDNYGNETLESDVKGALLDGTPPDPDRSTWKSEPTNTGNSIIMEAIIATDPSGPVEYYFRYTEESGVSNGAGDGHDSGWQSSNVYEDTDLTDGVVYYYRVRARDAQGNETQESYVGTAMLDSSILDKTPPNPNPSSWKVVPYNTGTSIRMEATVSSDVNGPVKYYFSSSNGHNSGWQSSNVYQDTGLTHGVVYYYSVKARDRLGNETNESSVRSATYDESILDNTPPTPNPSQWKTVPYNTGSAIRMVAKTASDAFGPIKYYFRCTDSEGKNSNTSGGGSHSGWQTSTTYSDTGLIKGRTYYYRVKARDKRGNETAESSVKSAVFDDSLLDFEEPTPNPPIWEIRPRSEKHLNKWWHHMKVYPVTDNEGNGVEYFFWCYDQSVFSSGWLNSGSVNVDPYDNPIGPNEYWVYVGSQYMPYNYMVRTKDQSFNENTGNWTDPVMVGN